MTNENNVTHNTKHTILVNNTKFTPYSVPPAHAPASVWKIENSPIKRYAEKKLRTFWTFPTSEVFILHISTQVV